MGKWLAALGAVLLLGAGIAALWFARDHQRAVSTPLAVGDSPRAYVLAPGATLDEVAAELHHQGVLSDPHHLRLHGRIRGDASRIKSGEYRIEPGTTPATLLDMLVAGRVVQHPITLLEGWTFKQIMAAVRASPHLSQTLDGVSTVQLMADLESPDMHPEGRFYPDTYYYTRDTTDLALLRRAHAAMQRRLQTEWEGRADGLPYSSPDDALVLASIIEKETAQPEERMRIAGVFVERLEKGMKLQTDPTVIYGMGDAFDGNIRRQDLHRDTPYNTYTRKGLPPTPIAMPGGESLHAALHPERDGSLYFVARGDGFHHFSPSYEQHRRAVVRYQLQQQKPK